MISSTLLQHYEHCKRDGIYFRDYERWKIDHTEMLMRGIREGLTTQRTDFGEAAGEFCIGLGAEPGLDSKELKLYDQVIHLSCIADIVSTALRQPTDSPWEAAKPIQIGDGPWWYSSAFLDPSGTHLRRIALVSGWSDDRHYSECRSWDTLGNVCVYGLPMQVVVIVLGQYRNGKRHGFWSHGLRHPISKKLRFRKKTDIATPFKSTWIECWREDYDEISTTQWLTAMIEDEVIRDVCFKIDIPVPEKAARQKILDLASGKLEKIYTTKELPEMQLSTCDFPIPCLFRAPCHGDSEPSGKHGFVKIS